MQVPCAIIKNQLTGSEPDIAHDLRGPDSDSILQHLACALAAQIEIHTGTPSLAYREGEHTYGRSVLVMVIDILERQFRCPTRIHAQARAEKLVELFEVESLRIRRSGQPANYEQEPRAHPFHTGEGRRHGPISHRVTFLRCDHQG